MDFMISLKHGCYAYAGNRIVDGKYSILTRFIIERSDRIIVYDAHETWVLREIPLLGADWDG